MQVASMAEKPKMPVPEEQKGVVDVGIGEAELRSSPDAHLQRKLGGKEVQLFAIGGAIGTSTFVVDWDLSLSTLIQISHRCLCDYGLLSPPWWARRPLLGLYSLVYECVVCERVFCRNGGIRTRSQRLHPIHLRLG